MGRNALKIGTSIHAKLTEQERAALEMLCSFEAVNLSEAVRLAIRESAKTREFWPPKSAIAIDSQTASVEVSE